MYAEAQSDQKQIYGFLASKSDLELHMVLMGSQPAVA